MVHRTIDVEIGLRHAIKTRALIAIIILAAAQLIAQVVISLGNAIEKRAQIVARPTLIDCATEVTRSIGKHCSIGIRVASGAPSLELLVETPGRIVESIRGCAEASGRRATHQ